MAVNPRAFVVGDVPFRAQLTRFGRACFARRFQDAGYEAVRADSQLSTANILADVVRNIATAKLVVADLTNSNPNVFYELGLAHGLGIPTLLLTQAVEKLPFDLRSYRTLEYSTQFDHAPPADRITGADRQGPSRRNTMPWSDPVNDFAPGARRAIADQPPLPTELTLQLYRASASLQQFLAVFLELAAAVVEVTPTVDQALKEVEPLQSAGASVEAQIGAGLEKLAAPLERYLQAVALIRDRLIQLGEPLRMLART